VEPIADGTLVVVGDDTQAFDAETYQIAAGEVTFEYRLDGFQEHSLVIEGREDEMRLVVENGETDRGTITLEPGRYILYCDIAGHRIGGMEARLLVG
jgi:plastocyanin